MYRKLERFDYKRDYLMLTGNPVIMGIVTAIVTDISEGKVRFLQWNSKHECYKVIQIDLLEQ